MWKKKKRNYENKTTNKRRTKTNTKRNNKHDNNNNNRTSHSCVDLSVCPLEDSAFSKGGCSGRGGAVDGGSII